MLKSSLKKFAQSNQIALLSPPLAFAGFEPLTHGTGGARPNHRKLQAIIITIMA